MDDAGKLLQSSLVLLRTSLTEAEHFLENWHEKYENINDNYLSFKQLTKQLNNEILTCSKQSKSYGAWADAIDISRELLQVSNKLHDIVTGPLIIIQAARNLAAITQQVSKLISQVGQIDIGDEDHIFSMLSSEQVNQVYQWVAENEAMRK